LVSAKDKVTQRHAGTANVLQITVVCVVIGALKFATR